MWAERRTVIAWLMLGVTATVWLWLIVGVTVLELNGRARNERARGHAILTRDWPQGDTNP